MAYLLISLLPMNGGGIFCPPVKKYAAWPIKMPWKDSPVRLGGWLRWQQKLRERGIGDREV
jgi:hypothetical protein